MADVERMIDPTVAAVMIEPIQGEGGVMPAPPGYLQDLRTLCDERDILLMVDEIQTGLGRTGRWWGFQHHLPEGIRPDVVTIAKALGNGMPIGACWATREVSSAFKPGDHGSTYSGQPLAASAALKVLEIMRRDDIPAMAARAGTRLRAGLLAIPGVQDVRGTGLLIAAELAAGNAKDVYARGMELGIVTNAVTNTSLRIAPPLNVSDAHIDEGVAMLARAISECQP